MAVLKMIIDKNRPKKDGSIPIRVSVSHKQHTSYIPTRFTVDSEKQWSNGAVIRRPDASMINMKLRGILDKYQETLDKIPNQSLYTCVQLKNLIVIRCDGMTTKTFQKSAEEQIAQLRKEGREEYASMLELCKRYFDKFYNAPCLLSDIMPSTIKAFKEWLKANTSANETTINKYLSHAKVIINYAILKQYVSYDTHPFFGVKIAKSPSRECDLSVDSLIKIRDAQPETKGKIVAQSLFMLSFYLGGMNLKDLMDNPLYGVDELEYERSKTRSRTSLKITIPIVDPAKDIIKEWHNRNTNKLDFGMTGSYKTFRRNVERDIKALADDLGIQEPITFYSARKTFSQFAADLGIPKSVIDYCLGHSNNNEVISYYTKVKKLQAAIAIKRVVDYICNPDQYKEFIELKREIMIAKLD